MCACVGPLGCLSEKKNTSTIAIVVVYYKITPLLTWDPSFSGRRREVCVWGEEKVVLCKMHQENWTEKVCGAAPATGSHRPPSFKRGERRAQESSQSFVYDESNAGLKISVY